MSSSWSCTKRREFDVRPRASFQLWLLALVTVIHGAGGQLQMAVPQVDNFRAPQEIGAFRKVYRSASASPSCRVDACSADDMSTTCPGAGATPTTIVWGQTTPLHFSYYDQENWHKIVHVGGWPNECAHAATGLSHPGQSPINVEPASTELAPADAKIQLSGDFKLSRPGLWVHNNGHSVGVHICGSPADCLATASFGAWPKVLRGLDTSREDEYFLLQMHIHWGSDSTKGSEHLVCSKSRSAELHMVFMNKRALTPDRSDPDSGTHLVVVGTMLQGGGKRHAGYSPFLDDVERLAKRQGSQGPLPNAITLSDLLPTNYSTQFYTYPGSLTTPPCSQKVTWFVLENYVQVSDQQLDQLRATETITHARGHNMPSIRAILMPVVALLVGALTYQFLHHYAPWMPYTLAIMIEGFLMDALAYQSRPFPDLNTFLICPTTSAPLNMPQNGVEILPQMCNSMQLSMDMWASIDGHLLLFIFLPVLLFGDSFGLNAHLFQKTFWQSLLLACPGVLLGTAVGGVFAYYLLPYGWSLNLSMAFGAILAATDPVAVVALLKSVGASDVLTMQITGESLMNDGTAMVMFTLFFNMHMGWVDYDAASVIGFFAKMTIASPAMGVAIGLLGYWWMSSASQKHSHADSTIQTTVTVGIAFLAFYVSEWEIQMSGVLATISAGLVLAKYAWPIVADPGSLENVWHAFEYFGNTLIFFIAGVLTRRALWNDVIQGADYGWCVLTYVMMMALRAVMMVLCYPILKRLGYGTSLMDAGFMVWGGLRGAVGLALAVFVRSALIQVDPAAAGQIFFMVAGLAFLTLLVNATTSGPILRKTGMAGITDSKRKLLAQAYKRLHRFAQEEYEKACLIINHDAIDVTEAFSELEQIRNTDKAFPVLEKDRAECWVRSVSAVAADSMVSEYQEQLSACTTNASEEDVKHLRECFMRVVKAKYWELIKENKLPKKSPAALLLLNSVSACINNLDKPLHDWDCVEPSVQVSEGGFTDWLLNLIDRLLPQSVTWDNDLHYALKTKSSEAAYHTAISFVEAHLHAQKKVAGFFGDTDEADSPEELTVLLESARQVQKAHQRLGTISSMLIKLIKSSTIAEMLSDSCGEFVHHMVEEGVLVEAEAEEMFHHLEHQRRRFIKGIKARARSNQNSIMNDIKRSSTLGLDSVMPVDGEVGEPVHDAKMGA
eukprot:TRINITY_DN34775_c0_g1_i1.p1 TRINITY_DN34775_c0_g1~~TRINITY_DN34775_c0_g1_i1.p1  ORF type:complete len:1179 (+),score=197.98 TRINITY_DN34775_c0_g1_i1:60-3596(+)